MKSIVKQVTWPLCLTSDLTPLRLQVKDAIGASMSFGGSGLSGAVNSLAVGIYEELTE